MFSINQEAPAKASASAEINAPVETVWSVLTDIPRWPDWNPDVKSASLDSGLAEGAEFRWKAGPGNIVSRIERIKLYEEIGWTGRTMGIQAAHVWRIRDTGAGRTAAETEESWDGILASVLRWPARRMLRNSLSSGLAHLKAEAERRAEAGVVTAP